MSSTPPWCLPSPSATSHCGPQEQHNQASLPSTPATEPSLPTWPSCPPTTEASTPSPQTPPTSSSTSQATSPPREDSRRIRPVSIEIATASDSRRADALFRRNVDKLKWRSWLVVDPGCSTHTVMQNSKISLRRSTIRLIIEVQVEGGNEDEFLPPGISCRCEYGSRCNGHAGRGIGSENACFARRHRPMRGIQSPGHRGALRDVRSAWGHRAARAG